MLFSLFRPWISGKNLIGDTNILQSPEKHLID